MGKSPKAKDYAPTEAEKTNTEIAVSRYNDFKTKYAPLLKKRAAESQTDAVKTTLRGRASADVMQAISKPSLQATQTPEAAGNMAEAVTGQLAEANRTARKYQNDVGVNVLARGNQQAATTQEGLSTVSRLATSAALQKAQDKQEVAQAKWNAIAKIGSAVVRKGSENYSQTGDFWTPGNLNIEKSADGKPAYDAAKS